jgi:hypothetical protein
MERSMIYDDRLLRKVPRHLARAFRRKWLAWLVLRTVLNIARSLSHPSSLQQNCHQIEVGDFLEASPLVDE